MKKKLERKIKQVWGFIMILLVATASWGLYSLFRLGMGSLLGKIGIQNEVWQDVSIVVIVLILLIGAGFGVFKGLKKLLNE